MRVGIDARKIGDFGIGTYIRGLLGGLVELQNGDEYVAFAPSGASIPGGVRHEVVDAPHYSVRELFAVGSAADRAKLDVFHAPHYVVPFTRIPLVVTIHDLIHIHQPQRNPLAPLYASTMLRRAVRRARVVLTVTEAIRSQVERELGARNVVVTPNGVEARGDAGVRRPDPAAPLFLYVGNDKPHKNVATLVGAFSAVRESMAAARLVLAGAPFERFRGIEGISTPGFVTEEELAGLYRSCTALVMPSREEGFGLPALEAMSRGAAVITSRDPALVEVTGDAALHADASDFVALGEAMLRIASDPALALSLGERGAKRASLFTWRRCAEATRDAYARVAGPAR